MTLKELKKEISESPGKDVFANLEIKLASPHTGINRDFIGLSSFYEYLNNQIEGFKKLGDDIPDDFKNSKQVLETFKRNFFNFWTNFKNNSNINQIKPNWDSQLGRTLRGGQKFFEYDAPNSIFLLDLYHNRKANYPGALAYISSGISAGAIQDRNYLNGLILAYEYFQKGECEIKKRRDVEKSSLSRFRNHIDEYISKSEGDFISYSAALKQKTDETIDEVTVFKTNKEEEFKGWFEKTSKSFSEFEASSHEKITDLENLYHEKLKLEAPAQYWNKRAKDLKIEGRWWLAGLILTIVAGVTIFIVALNWLANGVLEEIFKETASAIKWSVIFITLVSFLAFLIKTLSKMTFSTFHLSRDAEEREQLTYVFLAMQKEKAIDPTERHLIMQSLFSRADTGLLKDEGSPTMPGNIFDKIVASGK